MLMKVVDMTLEMFLMQIESKQEQFLNVHSSCSTGSNEIL